MGGKSRTTAGNFSWDAVYRSWDRRHFYHRLYTKTYFLFSSIVPNTSLKKLKFGHAMTLPRDNHDGI
jgi:hypothetical protein